MVRSLRRLLVVSAFVGSLLVAAHPAGAVDLEAPAPTDPKPGLWAEIDKECFGTSPGVRWRVGNNTNGPHLFGIYREGSLVFEVKVDPGEVKSSAMHSPLWEDTHQHFQIAWQSQGTVLAQLKPWLNCIEPDPSATVASTGAGGNACAGTVAVTVVNTGTQNADVKIIKDHSVVKNVLVGTDAAVTVEFEAEPGAGIAATYLNHGLYEFFFETVAVECTSDKPDTPAPPDDGGGGGGASLDDDPADNGNTIEPTDDPGPGLGEAEPEPVVTDLATPVASGTDLTREIAVLSGRHASSSSDGEPASSGLVWIVLVGALAMGAVAVGRVLRPQ